MLLGRHHEARRTDHLRMAFTHLSESAIVYLFLTTWGCHNLFIDLLPDHKRLAELGVSIASCAEITLLELSRVSGLLGTEWTLR